MQNKMQTIRDRCSIAPAITVGVILHVTATNLPPVRLIWKQLLVCFQVLLLNIMCLLYAGLFIESGDWT